MYLVLITTDYRKNEMAGECSTHGENGTTILIEKPLGNSPLVSTRRRWHDVEADLKDYVLGI
jgi:hypothetical protein